MKTTAAVLVTHRARWRAAILVCRKCQKKLDNQGFGPKGDQRLSNALARAVKSSAAAGGVKLKGRHAPVGVIDVGCLKLCPKHAVTVVSGDRPDRWLAVREGAAAEAVLVQLGIDLETPDTRFNAVLDPSGT